MKKVWKLGFLLLIVIIVFNFFVVSGKKFFAIDYEDESSLIMVMIEKNTDETDNMQKITLGSEQKSELKNLFFNSYFIKSFNRVITYPSSNRYDIIIKNKAKGIYQRIGVSGNYYISDIELGFYKITNPNFESELERIINDDFALSYH